MRKFISALCLGLCLVAGSTAAQTPADLLGSKSRDAGTISAIAQEQGYVRVIAHFDSPVPASDIRPDEASLGFVRTQVAASQDTIISSHFGSSTSPRAGRGFERGLTRFPITPGFAVNVDAAELQALASDPRVTIINYDRPVPPTLLQSVPLIGMTSAYAQGATGTGQAVAVLDTGVQASHEFLAGKVIAEACFSFAGGGGGAGTASLCPNGTPSQTGAGAANALTAQCGNGGTNICSHGTHVAGIAAGLNTSQSGGEPTNGVAKSGSIFAVQVFTRFNNAADCSPSAAPCVLAYNSDQILALNHVYANLTLAGGVKVASVNMSLGGGSYSGTCDTAPQKPAIDNLRSAGVLTAIAAGNNGFTSAIGAPGCISTAVTVGASTKSDVIASYSNMSSVVDVMAPGSDILSSVPNNAYAYYNGTSMATPHVAGAIAALRSRVPAATASQIESALISTGTPITDTRPGGTITKPRIRVDLALNQLLGGGVPPGPPNDNFANAITLSGQSGSTTGTNIDATKEAGEPGPYAGTGGKTVWWKWTPSASGQVTFNLAGSSFDTVLDVFVGNSVGALSFVAGNDDDPDTGLHQSKLTFDAQAGTTYRIRVDGYHTGEMGSIALAWSVTAGGNTSIVAAVAPTARTTTINSGVTAYATIINAGSVTATACSIALPAGVPANFLYQAIDSGYIPIGSPNTPINIAAGQGQGFYFLITPTQAMQQDINLVFDCTNTSPAPVFAGINQFRLSAAATQSADVLMASATSPDFGLMRMQNPSASGFFAVAAVNIGPTASITFTPGYTPIGQATRTLPLTSTICYINPTNGSCISPVGPSVTLTLATGQIVNFGVFVNGQGTYIPLDLANNRVFVVAQQGATPLSQTSVAVQMISPPPASQVVAER